MNNLQGVNTHNIKPKLIKKFLLQDLDLLQYLDVFPFEKSITCYFWLGQCDVINHMKNENKIERNEPSDTHVAQYDNDY